MFVINWPVHILLHFITLCEVLWRLKRQCKGDILCGILSTCPLFLPGVLLHYCGTVTPPLPEASEGSWYTELVEPVPSQDGNHLLE